jgi:hypothetical protein
MKFSLEKLHIFQPRRGLAHVPKTREFINPDREWTYGFIIAAVCFFSGVGYIAFDFYVQFEVPEDVSIDSKGITYRAREVEEYADFYDAKEIQFNELRKHASVIIENVDENHGEGATSTEALAEDVDTQ